MQGVVRLSSETSLGACIIHSVAGVSKLNTHPNVISSGVLAGELGQQNILFSALIWTPDRFSECTR